MTMFQSLKTSVRPMLRLSMPFIAIFTAVTLVDLLLQREVRMQIEQYFEDPFLSAIFYLGRSLKWGLLLSAPAFLLGRRARPFYLLLWPYLVLVETIETVARRLHGMVLDGDWLMIVYTSSSREMCEYFGQFSWLGILVALLGFLMAVVAGLFFFRRVRYPAVSRLSVAVGILFCVPVAICNFILSNPLMVGNEVMYTFLPVDTAHNYAMYSDIARTAREPRLPANTLDEPERIKETLGVFVIGESATRSHWHLYGYDRPTTPMMDGIRPELVVFKDVRAIYSSTGKSLRILLTEATCENPIKTRSTFPQQCAAGGYRCSLFSAHSRWGRWEGVESLLFSGCDTKFYLHEQPDSTPDSLDDALLPPMEKAVLSDTSSGQIVFLHLMGSHAPPLFRYPLKRSIYPRYEGDVAPGVADPNSFEAFKTDLYDNSIAFTDLILGQTINMLRSVHRPCFLVYLSDHGETPSSSHWRDATSPDLLIVPFVIWFSPEYRTRYPETVAAVSALADEPRELDRLLPVFRALVHLDRPDGLSAR